MTDTRVICSACAAKFLRRFQSVASKTNEGGKKSNALPFSPDKARSV